MNWKYVTARFKALLANLQLSNDQRADGETKSKGVIAALNRHYYNIQSDSANSFLIGSWGKYTRVRPPRDVDVLFQIPYETYQRFLARTGNIQSQLLQEVRGVLLTTYPNTNIKGDGPVVLVPFGSYAVEVLPAILLKNGQYWICEAKNEGYYKPCDPKAEIAQVESSNAQMNNNTRDLIRMMKCWQAYCNVPLKSFFIELLAIEFLTAWPHRGQDHFWYDWMVRDFFYYLCGRGGGIAAAPGTGELVFLGNSWVTRAQTARDHAVVACGYEYSNMEASAGLGWQAIFGPDIPATL